MGASIVGRGGFSGPYQGPLGLVVTVRRLRRLPQHCQSGKRPPKRKRVFTPPRDAPGYAVLRGAVKQQRPGQPEEEDPYPERVAE